MSPFQTFLIALYSNSWQNWLTAVGLITLSLILFPLLRRLITIRVKAYAERTVTDWDNFIIDLIEHTKGWFLLAVALYIGLVSLDIPSNIYPYLTQALLVLVFIQVGYWSARGITFWVKDYRTDRLEDDASSVTVITALGLISKIVIWIIVFLLILDNFGVEITSLVAGLGITGIAVALAVQNILGDLLASLSIVLDQPFVIGDFIVVGNHSGTVEKIGLKTTRVRSLVGEQIIFSNSDLLSSRINNYKRMEQRRIVFTIGVRYETPTDKLEQIPQILEEVVNQEEQVRFDRSHFKGMGDFALTFETVYYVLTADYAHYMTVQQNMYLALHRRFAQEKIEFAYPTQTIFLEKETT